MSKTLNELLNDYKHSDFLGEREHAKDALLAQIVFEIEATKMYNEEVSRFWKNWKKT